MPALDDRTLFVTGATASYFPLVCTLQASFERFCPGRRLMVADFGLSPGQCQYFEQRDELLAMPSRMSRDSHPYLLKGSLYHYVEPLDPSGVVWIDGDCVLCGPFESAFESTIAAGSAAPPALAAAVDQPGWCIEDYLNEFGPRMAPFSSLVATNTRTLEQPYLNCGLYFVRSLAFLRDWAELSETVQPHLMFEQNLFNLLAYREGMSTLRLDETVWNVHDKALDELAVEGAGGSGTFSVTYRGRPIIVLHLTAANERRLVDFAPFALAVGTRHLVGMYRCARDPSLKALSLALLRHYVSENESALAACDILTSDHCPEEPMVDGSPLSRIMAEHTRRNRLSPPSD